MENNEIYINGVDVAGCKFYEKNAVLYDCTEDTTSGDNGCYKCKDEPNCYYKQLKRLEQENAELKWENKKIKLSNENLRLALKTYEMPEVVKVLTDWRTGELDLRINKYKQTLQEIKAIAKTRFVNGINQEADIYNTQMGRILDLITQTEEE